MSAVLQTHPGAASDVNSRLTFQKNLQTVTNKIHATSNVDEIMLEVSADICTLFNADRLTIYTVGEDKQTIVSKVKTGLNSFKDLKLPIAEHSIAGYVGLSKRMLNLKDVYDEGELKSHNPNLRFLQEVDKRTGYRTKQMLVAPVAEPGSSELVGVVQLINNRAGMPFGTQEGRRRRNGADRGIPGQDSRDWRGPCEIFRGAVRNLQARPHQTDGSAEKPEARLRRIQPVGADRGSEGRSGHPLS